MGKKKGKKSGKHKTTTSSGEGASSNHGDGIWVDPARVRFQHARIRPFFSGCGRSVEGTLDEIRQGKIQPSDLPPIQVLIGPSDEDVPWYFSLNNRRLWVLKRCREEGLLPNQQIFARVRKPKSEQEVARYTVENCALEAKIIPEKPKAPKTTAATATINDPTDNGNDKRDEAKVDQDDTIILPELAELSIGKTKMTFDVLAGESSDDESSDSSDDELRGPANRFSALL